ncbi:hypothetical protein BDN70DRAFT_876421 [Pholiota conissans]|uniref:Ribosome biogenesis protein SLX9 n=1 Tax=Pholiota conissans TaxID=109636 RepID=A0A9P6D2H6_9AGAR|nr:hypothetical protein BDN70DRAFT_876421 [Pholiota conissans]
MPRATRNPRHGAHLSSAKSKTKSAWDDEPASFDFMKTETPIDPVLDGSLEQQIQPIKQQCKKEKQMEKRQNFLEKLGPSTKQLSKSSARRQKRKAKEQLTGDLDDLHSALASVEMENADAEDVLLNDVDSQEKSAPIQSVKPGTIGKSGSSTLSKAQRKRVLELERLRHPLILTNSEFSSNPFKTIRTHLQNTLLKRPPPA